MPPNTMTLTSALAQVTKPNDQAHWDTVTKMLAGDHWLGGLGWVGPRLPSGDVRAGDFLAAVFQQFIPKNALLEITRRHTSAVIGRYPIIKLAKRDATAQATKAEQDLMRQGEGALTAWLDRVQALPKFQRFTRYLLLGQAQLQGYIPTGEIREGRVPAGDLLTSIQRIRLRVPEPGTATVTEDESTGSRYAVYKSQTGTGQDVAEITYLTDSGQTVVRRVEGGTGNLFGPDLPDGTPPTRDTGSDALDLHGLLTITQAQRDQFLTPTLVRNNFMLNFAKTATLRNAELAAILERYGVGILPPGQWKKDNHTQEEVFVPDPKWRPGGSNVSFFTSQSTLDKDGNAQYAPGASYGRFEPVNPAPLIATKQDAYHDMLDEAAQSHIRMSGDATASGESRIQAMNDFRGSLYDTAAPLESALATHLEMTLAWAAALAGQPGLFRDYRVTVQCRILAAQPTADERRVIIEEKKEGLRSTENAMSEIGVEDTDQMLEAVRQEQEDALKRGQAAAAALGNLLDPPGAGGDPTA